MRHVRSIVAVAFAGIAATAAAQQPAGGTAPAGKEEHVRGVIASVAGDAVTVRTPDGRSQTTLKLAPNAFVAFAARSDVDAIKENAFVGAAAVEEQGGTLRALEVHVFPESARGKGEGHRPWDLKPGSSMTNAMVSSVGAAKETGGSSGSSMTNATVSGAQGAAGGKKLELTYKDGKKTLLVPPGTPVVSLEPADRSALQPGQHVFAAGPRQADGSVSAGRVYVGKGGVVPPM